MNNTTQTDLAGNPVTLDEDKVKTCLDLAEQKTSTKTVYPGEYFNITITDADRDKLDHMENETQQRKFIASKIKPKRILPSHDEGKAYQDDIDLFQTILFVTGTETMRRESYNAVMSGGNTGQVR